MRTSNDLEERTFTRSVRADKAVEPATLNDEINASQGFECAEVLRDAMDIKNCRFVHVVGACFLPPRPYEPIRSRSETTKPRRPFGLNTTMIRSISPRITGQICLIVAISARK